MQVTAEGRKRVHSLVLDFIRSEDLVSKDGFPQDISRVYVQILEEEGGLPSTSVFLARAQKVKTSFFRLNTGITRPEFTRALLDELNDDIGPIVDTILASGSRPETEGEAVICREIFVDDIDSFSRVKQVPPKEVADSVPLNLAERKVKRALAGIIGEKFIPKDWGGETSDLLTSRVVVDGGRITAAFLLKGPSVGRLTIAKCGKNGDQILRLVREPATLFVVQHVGEIASDVREMLRTFACRESRKGGRTILYCVIDGVDTARILRAYRKP